MDDSTPSTTRIMRRAVVVSAVAALAGLAAPLPASAQQPPTSIDIVELTVVELQEG